MPRPERPLDPLAGPVQAFAAELRKLRDQAGNPKYLQMARQTGKSRTALAEAAGGDHLPTWETVEAYLTACGADPAPWRLRWEEVEEQVRARRGLEPRLPVSRPSAEPAAAEREVPGRGMPRPETPGPDVAPGMPGSGVAEPPTAGPASAGAAAALVWADAPERRLSLDRRLVALVGVLVVLVVLSASAAGVALLAGTDGGGIAAGDQVPSEAAVHANPQPVEIYSADLASVRLASRPAGGCADRGCALPDKVWPGEFWVASCYTAGEMMTDANPDRLDGTWMPNSRTFRSNGWYGLPLHGERLGYLPEVNVTPPYRGGLHLPDCPQMQPLQPK